MCTCAVCMCTCMCVRMCVCVCICACACAWVWAWAYARAGTGVSSMAWSREEVLNGMKAMLKKLQGPNFLPYAAGGGVENVGVSRAVNEMLVQAPRLLQTDAAYPAMQAFTRAAAAAAAVAAAAAAATTATASPTVATASVTSGDMRYLHLFPMWPVNEPAAFKQLRTKGGFVVSATYTPSESASAAHLLRVAVTGVQVLSTSELETHCVMMNPWPGSSNVTSTCVEGIPTPVTWLGGDKIFFTFATPVGVNCKVNANA